MELNSKKEYRKPSIEDFGAVTELTATGLTNPGGDGKSGSVNSNGV
jgi:hypothetical protein